MLLKVALTEKKTASGKTAIKKHCVKENVTVNYGYTATKRVPLED